MTTQTKATAATTTAATLALRQELAALDARRVVLVTALNALESARTTAPKVTPVLTFPPRQRMRNARRGERQARVLDAYGKLTQEVSVRHFLRSLSQAPRQQTLYRNTMERQITLGRITRRRGVLIPRRHLAVA